MNDLDQKPETTDQVEALLRSTGRRPSIPADTARRVKEATRTHWRSEVSRRSSRRKTVVMLTLAAAAALTVVVGLGIKQRAGLSSPAAITASIARAESVVGSAWLQSRSGDSAVSSAVVRSGLEFEAGSQLATENDGRLAIRMASGHSVRFDTGTRARLLDHRVIALDKGAVYIDSLGPRGAARGFVEIRTPLGTLRDVGTQFEARLDSDSLRVRVREGAVFVNRTDAQHEVNAGQEMRMAQDGNTTVHEMSPFGNEWAWVNDVTPMFEIEGKSLQEFLDWIARERGLTLRYEDENGAGSAPGISLNGSVQGMSLDQALESVLVTCRMSYRIVGDDLLVQSNRGLSSSS